MLILVSLSPAPSGVAFEKSRNRSAGIGAVDMLPARGLVMFAGQAGKGMLGAFILRICIPRVAPDSRKAGL